MDINRDNYEEYFLLYADNELEASEREAVEHFVDEHPDLKESFDQILQTISDSGKGSMDFKAGLFRLETGTGAEEAMLLQLDGEISEEEARQLNELLQSNPELQKEFELLKQTRLEPETISCNFKDALYRQPVRRIPINKWVVGIAAMLIGAGIFFGLKEINSKPPTIQQGSETDFVSNTQSPSAVQKSNATLPVKEERITQTNGKGEAQSTLVTPEPNAIHTAQYAETAERKTQAAPERDLQLATEADHPLENINNLHRNLIHVTTVPVLVTTPEIKEPEFPVEEVERFTASTPINIVKTSFGNEDVESNSADDSESMGHVLVVNEDKVKRSKVGKWIRKVKNTIEEKATIRMPDQIQVAGFEIAIK